jgi:uncharacterized spore protein YtfJ
MDAGNRKGRRLCSTGSMNLQQILQGLADRVAAGGSVKSVYGEPSVSGTRTVIPVARVRYAFGGGAGSGNSKEEGEATGGGGGGKVSAQPCGALEIAPEGTRFIHFGGGRRAGAALAIGFVLGAAVTALALADRKPGKGAEPVSLPPQL